MANFARLPYAPTESLTPWNIPPYDDHFSHLTDSSYENGLISQSRFQSDKTEEVAQASETQSKGKGKGKAPYKKWTSEEQTFLVDLWAEKHEQLESKDARKVWQEICEEMELNFGTKKTVEKCQRKIKYLIDKYKDTKSSNRSQTGGHIRKSVLYDKIDRVLGTRDVVTLKHVVEAGSRTAPLSPNPPSSSTDDFSAQPSSRTPSPQQSTSATSGTRAVETSDAEARPSKLRKERKRMRTTKRELPEDGGEEETTSLKKSIDSMEKQGEKLTEFIQGMQQTQSKQLEMITSFMGSLLETLKDKK